MQKPGGFGTGKASRKEGDKTKQLNEGQRIGWEDEAKIEIERDQR